MSIDDDNARLSFYALTEKYPDEQSAVEYFESKRWPTGAYCPKCGSVDVYDCKARRKVRLWKCRDCGQQFTVTSGTVMESTKLPLRKWLFAFHEIGGAKKGISSRSLARRLGITLKSAWHLSHRVRATMSNNKQRFTGVVETDETYIGGKRKHRGRGYRGNKIAVQTIVSRTGRGGKRSRSGPTSRYRGGDHGKAIGQAQTIALAPTDRVDGRTVGAKLRTHTEPEKTVLMTDDSPIYDKVGQSFAEHHSVNHSKEEYVRREADGHVAHTNTAEGLFANLKRQITGTHHHTSKKHLPRYLEEYDHKYNKRDKTDTEITEAAIANIEGRRVTLFKTAAGGDSLFDRKQDEPSQTDTNRGKHMQRGGGKRGVFKRSRE